MTTRLTPFWRIDRDGIVVAIKAQPRARRAHIGGLTPDGTRLRIAVTAPPEDGRATESVCRALAEALGLPARAVTLRSGGGSRDKLLHVAADPSTIGAPLDRLAQGEMT